MELQIIPADYTCPVEKTLEILDGKWKPLIVYYLLSGTKHFGQVQRMLPAMTKRTLTQHLCELERDGIVSRQVYDQIPPRVEYSLTATGRTLEPLLLAMLQWGSDYLAQQNTANDS